MNVFLIIKTDKYNSFDEEDKKLVENNLFLKIEDIKIKNPYNPANLMDAKLIYYHL